MMPSGDFSFFLSFFFQTGCETLELVERKDIDSHPKLSGILLKEAIEKKEETTGKE